ncbi:hypothetical protein ET1_15_00990 [Edwardsiella tarda ATCC 15947 = NBRC 105688]|nr:hypothetical protein ET1_15_00990 [Edwardsiella tarda ATCC 15947 = NBRC 105688]
MLRLYIVIATVNITALLNHPPASIGGLQRAQRRAFAPPDRLACDQRADDYPPCITTPCVILHHRNKREKFRPTSRVRKW